MRRFVLSGLLVLFAFGFGMISPELERHLSTAAADQKLPVHIVLKNQYDTRLLFSQVDGLSRQERRVRVAQILGDFARREQESILRYLAEREKQGEVKDIRPIWIVNAVACEATPAVIRELAQRADVHYVNYDLAWCPDLLEKPGAPAEPQYDATWGVRKIRAPEVWAQGYTGQGVVCGHIDTGCDYTHPDLADHMWEDPNYPYHGWNFEENNNNPMDQNGHGTHTAGTVASDGTSGTQCGVAPDARIMVCRVRTVADSVAESQCWQAMQFVVSPPLSPANGADLYTMSLGWMLSWNPHQATWRQVADNVNAAGVIQIIAAGNERGQATPPSALRCPGNVPPPWWNPQNTGTGTLSGVISIGATDSTDAIAYFSSPGPVTWQNVAPYNDYPYPPGLTKPDVSAPGVAVISCRIGGGYQSMDGTSMATPHTAGTVCLMLSKNPNLTPRMVDSILEVTAVDLGTAGKDNDFGAGRIDAFAAVTAVPRGPYLKMLRFFLADSSGNTDGYIDPGESASLRFWLKNDGNAFCANTRGILRSFDFRLLVTDSTGSWGTIAPQDSAYNLTDRFLLFADTSLRAGTLLPCTLYVTGESADYATKFGIELRVGMPGQLIFDHDTNNCRLSVSCLGALGYLAPESTGSGFCYPKTAPSILTHASLAWGTDTLYVVDRYYTRPVTAPPDTEFLLVDSLRNIYPPQKGHEHYRAWFSDRNHPRSKLLVASQNSYADGTPGYRDFVTIVYTIQNNGSTTLSNFYAGIFADFTIDTAGDICDQDSLRRFIYITSAQDSTPVAGIKILEPDSGVHLTAIDPAIYYLPDSSLRDAQKWRMLSGQVRLPRSTRPDNWALCASAGPFTINPFSAIRFAVAFVGGNTIASALVNADSAQRWYRHYIGTKEPATPSSPLGSALTISPNPFTRNLTIRLNLPEPAPVRLTLHDISGRKVAEIYQGTAQPGTGELRWSAKGLNPGVYFIRLQTPGMNTTERAILVR
ncbi:MAG: S8 family peptidase [candidate division WOR-3 bacterium]|nr:S8 family peptidase [candidate division WOR-3 bacterium]